MFSSYEGCFDGQSDDWMVGWLGGQTHYWNDGWIDGFTNAWMNGCFFIGDE